MTSLNKLGVIAVTILLLCIAVTYANVLRNMRLQQIKYDMPEEFLPQVVSHDRAHPTEMMVVYDSTKNAYIFEFMDK